jgi:hypothetical protein
MRCDVIYFRVAMRMDQWSLWNWRSTVLNAPGTLFDFLKIYDRVANHRLRIFFATSRELMNQMLVRENNGLVSNSVTVEQFLQSGRRIDVQQIQQFESELGQLLDKELMAKSVTTGQLGDERSPSHATPTVETAHTVISGAAVNSRERSPFELMQEESKRSRGGDYDTPYTFTLPTSMRQALAWTRLLAKVQRGELEP